VGERRTLLVAWELLGTPPAVEEVETHTFWELLAVEEESSGGRKKVRWTPR
jgi:hypothetical protein